MTKLWMVRWASPSGKIWYVSEAPDHPGVFALCEDRLKSFGWLTKIEAEDYLAALRECDPDDTKKLSSALEVCQETFYEDSPQVH